MTSGSYSSKTRGGLALIRETAHQVEAHVRARRNLAQVASGFLEGMRRDEREAAAIWGRPFEGADVLDIGTGALGSQACYLACRGNRVTSIDLEQQLDWSVRGFLEVARRDGPRRALKTVGRSLIGVDRAFPGALAREMGLAVPTEFTRLKMNAATLDFPDASFDLVYSYDVLEHVDDLDATLAEVARVTRPGGFAFFVLMPYTSEGGSHDYRLIGGQRGGLPYWAHLRPSTQALVQPNAYVNGLGLRQVEALCRRHLPGVQFAAPPVTGDLLRGELRRLRQQRELLEYPDDEELLAVRLKVFWHKPTSEQPEC